MSPRFCTFKQYLCLMISLYSSKNFNQSNMASWIPLLKHLKMKISNECNGDNGKTQSKSVLAFWQAAFMEIFWCFGIQPAWKSALAPLRKYLSTWYLSAGLSHPSLKCGCWRWHVSLPVHGPGPLLVLSTSVPRVWNLIFQSVSLKQDWICTLSFKENFSNRGKMIN